MTEVPKIVHDRLRATAAQTGPGQNASELQHPGADLLTAFAEQSLSLSERESLLEHLAGCGDCREVVMLALPEADAIVSAPAETERTTAVAIRANRGWLRSGAFSWVNLRWATLAAAVVVVAAVLALRPGSHNDNDNQAKLTPVSAPPPASAPADVERQIAMAPPPSAGLAKEDLARKDLGKAELAQADRLRSVPQTRSASKPEARQFVSNLDLKANQDLSTEAKRAPAPPRAPNAEYGMLLAGSTNGVKNDSERADRPTTAGASGARLAVTNGASTGRNTETLEVESAAATVPPEASFAGGQIARDEAPAVEKAKPATQELDANATASSDAQKTPVTDVPNAHKYSAGDFAYRNTALSKAAALPRATWAITAGVLQRSLDGGQTWESALQADHPHPLTCYVVSGRDVWAGGQAGTLLHSPDGGATWTKVHPWFKGQTLTSDVTHIDAPGVGKITVSAGDKEIKETWSSADGGLSWEKK